MTWFWLWVLILGVLIMVGGMAAARFSVASSASRVRPSTRGLLWGVLLPILAFLLCLPASFPFASGLALGYGVLLGLGAALLALLTVWLASPQEEQHGSLGATAAALGGVALIWISATEMLFHGDPSYALLGGLAGLLLTLLPLRDSEDAGRGLLEFFGLTALVLGLGAYLALKHYAMADLRPQWALPSVVLAGGLLGVVVVGLMAGRTRAAGWLGAAGAVLLGLGAWFGAKALFHGHGHPASDAHLLYMLPLGWLTVGLGVGAAANARHRLAAQFALPLLAVVLVLIGFGVGGAYGVALALAAGIAFALPLPATVRPEGRAALRWFLTFGVLYLAYRLFLALYADHVRGDVRLEFGRHYVLLGLVAALLWAAARRALARGRFSDLLHWAALALAPVVLFAAFGYEALLGLLLGLLVVQLLALTQGRFELDAVYFPLAAVWALIIPNWADSLTSLSRDARAGIVAVAVLLVAWALWRAPAERAEGSPSKEG